MFNRKSINKIYWIINPLYYSGNFYDIFSNTVVVAKSKEEAIRISPSPAWIWHENVGWVYKNGSEYYDVVLKSSRIIDDELITANTNKEWPHDITLLKIEEIGIANKKYPCPYLICANYYPG